MTNKTTTFIGDIRFKDGDTERLASELATIDEVNDALAGYYTKSEIDTKIADVPTGGSSNTVWLEMRVVNDVNDRIVDAPFGETYHIEGTFAGRAFTYEGVIGTAGNTTTAIRATYEDGNTATFPVVYV